MPKFLSKIFFKSVTRNLETSFTPGDTLQTPPTHGFHVTCHYFSEALSIPWIEFATYGISFVLLIPNT